MFCIFIIGSSIGVWSRDLTLFVSMCKHYHYRLTNGPSPPHRSAMLPPSHINFSYIYGSVSELFYSMRQNQFLTTLIAALWEDLKPIKTGTRPPPPQQTHTPPILFLVFQTDQICVQSDMTWLIFVRKGHPGCCVKNND